MINGGIASFLDRCQLDCSKVFQKLDDIEMYNTKKVLKAFQDNRVAMHHFAATTGYGYGDMGRDTLEKIFAQVLGTQDALVRPQIVSGTHALTLCLYGILRPNDTLISAAGKPYDTLEEVIGISGDAGQGSLRDFGINYKQVELAPSGEIDISALVDAIDDSTKLVLIQRSRGYDWRPSLSIKQIGDAICAIKAKKSDALVMVDNCYGELTDTLEPSSVGADIMAGSLIKNLGGGIAPTGGYIAGRKDAVELIANRLTSPGIGREVGSYDGGYQAFYQGLFIAPHVVMQAIKTAVLAARAYELLGFDVHPVYDAPRSDIIQAIKFKRSDILIAFCQAVQLASPVDSEAVPEPWDMPGYQYPVIMAAGTFIAGASIELSADAPIREPYIGYLQGGLTFAHGRIGIETTIKSLIDKGYVTLPQYI